MATRIPPSLELAVQEVVGLSVALELLFPQSGAGSALLLFWHLLNAELLTGGEFLVPVKPILVRTYSRARGGFEGLPLHL